VDLCHFCTTAQAVERKSDFHRDSAHQDFFCFAHTYIYMHNNIIPSTPYQITYTSFYNSPPLHLKPFISIHYIHHLTKPSVVHHLEGYHTLTPYQYTFFSFTVLRHKYSVLLYTLSCQILCMSLEISLVKVLFHQKNHYI
jgi:hypothetical protein